MQKKLTLKDRKWLKKQVIEEGKIKGNGPFCESSGGQGLESSEGKRTGGNPESSK